MGFQWLKSVCYNLQPLLKLEEEVPKFPKHLKSLKQLENHKITYTYILYKKCFLLKMMIFAIYPACYKLKSDCYNIQSLQKLEEEVPKFPKHLKTLKSVENSQSYVGLSNIEKSTFSQKWTFFLSLYTGPIPQIRESAL